MEHSINDDLISVLLGAAKKQSCGSKKKDNFCKSLMRQIRNMCMRLFRHDINLNCNVESINFVIVDLEKEDVENLVMECKGNINNMKR